MERKLSDRRRGFQQSKSIKRKPDKEKKNLDPRNLECLPKLLWQYILGMCGTLTGIETFAHISKAHHDFLPLVLQRCPQHEGSHLCCDIVEDKSSIEYRAMMHEFENFETTKEREESGMNDNERWWWKRSKLVTCPLCVKRDIESNPVFPPGKVYDEASLFLIAPSQS